MIENKILSDLEYNQVKKWTLEGSKGHFEQVVNEFLRLDLKNEGFQFCDSWISFDFSRYSKNELRGMISIIYHTHTGTITIDNSYFLKEKWHHYQVNIARYGTEYRKY